MSFNHGGYDNDDGFEGRDRPQKEILFRDETMREILSRAAATGSHDIGPELMASISSHSTAQRSSSFTQNSRQSPPRSSASRQNSHINTPPRDSNHDSGIRTYRDREGNLVQEGDSNGNLMLRAHDPKWDEVSQGPSRTSTGISVHRNAAGDHVQQYNGEGNLRLGTHYDDSPPHSEGRTSPPVYETRDREGNMVKQYDGDSEDLPIRAHYDW